jgi:hypothetical protein
MTRPGAALAAAVVLLTGYATSASAQSLGDVARREAERRQQVTSGKVYTNEDLGAVDEATPPPPQTSLESPSTSGGRPSNTPAAAAPAAEAAPGKEQTVIKGREKRDEQYWRGLMRDLRGRLDKANANLAAQEARLAEIDAGEQTPVRMREREIVTESLTRAQRDVRYLTEEVTRFVTRAQMAKVPPEWIQ